MTKRFNRIFAALTVFSLMVSLFLYAQPVQAATTWSDVRSGHWAYGPIYSWTNQGLIGGFSDGTFRPNQPITKAEFITFANRAFGFRETTEISFADVKPTAWYAGEIRRAVAWGYAGGNELGLFEPNKPITRLESMTMLYTILRLGPTGQDYVSGFKDAATLTDTGRTVMNTAVAEGYIGGFDDKTLRPSGTLTRAQMVAILARVVGIRYGSAGVYGPETGIATVTGNATIPVTGVTLRNTIVKGDLYVTEGVGDGEVTLQSVKVEGRTIFAGGGDHSINNTGTTELPHVIITDRNGNVHIVFMDDASSSLISWQSGGTYESTSENNRPSIVLSSSIPAGSTVQLVGNFENVDIEAADISFQLGDNSQVSTLQIDPTATGNTLTLGGTIETLDVQAETDLTVTGSIQTITVGEQAGGTTLVLSGSVGSVQLQAETALTVSATATVESIVATATAGGSSITIEGQVTGLQTSAPLAVSVEEGATLTSLVLEEGATGTNLTTAEGVTAPTVTAPDDLTWNNNGTEQTGSTPAAPPVSGGGGGGVVPPPPVPTVGVIELVPSTGPVISTTINAMTGTINLTSLPDTTTLKQVVIRSSSGSPEVTIQSVTARDFTLPVVGVTGSAPLTLDVSKLTGPWEFLLQLKPSDGSWEFDGDMALGTLRAIVGGEFTINGKLDGRDMSILVQLPSSTMPIPTPWGDVRITGTSIDMTVTRTGTRLDGHYSTMMTGLGGIMILSGKMPTEVRIEAQPWRSYASGLEDLKSDILAVTGYADWTTITLGDLSSAPRTFQFKVLNNQSVESTFTVTIHQ